MTAIINLFIAAVLIFKLVQAASHKGQSDSLHERLMVFILMTGMFQTGGFDLFVNLSAWRLLIWTAVVGFILYFRRNPDYYRPSLTQDLPVLLYKLFLLWCLYEWTRSPDLMFGFRAFLKLFYPVFILLLARKAALEKNFYSYLQKMVLATLVISVFTSGISEKIPYLTYNPFLEGIFWPRATFADHAAIVSGALLVLIYSKEFSLKIRKRYIMGFIWLCLSPMAVANRTGLLATSATIAGFFFIKYKTRALPVIAAVFLAGVFVFTSVEEFRTSTFYNPETVTAEKIYKGQIDFENIDSSGRFNLWAVLLGKLYAGNRMIGSGLGAQQYEMYTYSKHYGIKVVHSDYVILLCDTGNIGLALYLLFASACLFTGVRYAWQGKTKTIKASGTLVVTSWLACLCAMLFDNVFNYSFAAHSLPFAFTGMLLGIIHNTTRTDLKIVRDRRRLKIRF